MSFSTPNNVVINTGEGFIGGRLIQFTVLTDTVISDSDGNAFGSGTAGESLEGKFPQGVFTVTSGSIKIWNK